MEVNKRVFSKNLQYYMHLREKNQSDLVKDLNLNKGSVSLWYNGTRFPRDDKTVERIAKYLGCTVADLINEKPADDGYYENEETARLAQQMYDDPQMRALFDMKRGMKPEVFQAHYDMMKKLYEVEHPEDSDDFGGC